MEIVDVQVNRGISSSFRPDVCRYSAVQSYTAVADWTLRDVQSDINGRESAPIHIVPAIDGCIQRYGGIRPELCGSRYELPSPESQDVIYLALVYGCICLDADAVGSESGISLYVYRQACYVCPEPADGYSRQGITDEIDPGFYIDGNEYSAERPCGQGCTGFYIQGEIPSVLSQPESLQGESQSVSGKPSSDKHAVYGKTYPVALRLSGGQPASEFHLLDVQCGEQCVLCAAQNNERSAVKAYPLEGDSREGGYRCSG